MTKNASPTVLVVMGVSGSGKTTVGRPLADRLGWHFVEGDEVHPPANVAKMRSGQPLTDDDRWPWLRKVADVIDEDLRAGHSAVVTCSALKRAYRDVLSDGRPEVAFVHLHASREELVERVSHRKHEYMPASLLDSQLAALEPLGPDERGVVVDATEPAEDLVDDLAARFSTVATE